MRWCRAGEEEEDPCYSPQKALTLALTDWLAEFLTPDHPGGRASFTEQLVRCRSSLVLARSPGGLKKEPSEEEPMQTDMGESCYAPGAEEKPLYTAEPLSLEDLKLLAELFYLPYEHGLTARTMLQELDWLKQHSAPAEAGEVGPPALQTRPRAAAASSCFLSPDGWLALQSSALR